jgi:DNA-binding response OmpR family regulator
LSRYRRVLVVEDDERIALLLADVLNYDGYEVDIVHDGAEALEYVRGRRPDAILLDLRLPTVHGWDFVERYRDVTEGQSIPIIVVSGAGPIPDSMYAMGVRQFIAKPFLLHELIGALEAI